MCSAPTSAMLFSGNMRSSRCSCATNSVPTTSTTSVSKRDWIISMRSATSSRPSSAGSPVSRPSGSNVHTDFPLLQRIALPMTVGSVRHPGIKIQDTRIIRLLEVLLHAGTHVGGWTAREIHEAVLTTFHLSADTYGLNQLRYDLRKLKGHGLLERDSSRYAYLLTPKGVQVALLFLFFHKRLCGPLANSRFHHRSNPQHRPDSRLELAYHRADKAHRKDRRSPGRSLNP